jgi:hypothetical protein
MHIYDFNSQSWTTQLLSAAGTDPNTLTAILDRDTNVFFALSNSQLYSLDMGTLTQADGGTRSWSYVQAPPFAQNNAYPKPVMGLGTNHIHFLNSGTPAEVDIFVIHFSYTQPEKQVFAPIENGGQGFPSTTGQTATIFKGLDQTQQKFVFIPDAGGNTYVFDTAVSTDYNESWTRRLIRILQTNTTQAMAPPTDKATSRLAASRTEIVQMTNSGDVYWIPYNPDDAGPNYGATWSKLGLSLAPPTMEHNTSNSTSLGTTSTSTTISTGTATGSTASSTSNGCLTAGKLSLPLTALMALGLGMCGL